jgi:site-specific DNA-cytosine methylase
LVVTTKVAEHRPAARRRTFRHDDLVAVDLFSGFGGLTQGIERAGFTTIMAANHNRYKIQIHEANHPSAEHWVADLVDPESADYHSARDLPPADLLAAGVSCVNHSQANTTKAYAQGLSLFDLEDPEWEQRVTRSERDRATANCVLHYAAQHHPRLILVECTTELTSWGPAVPGRRTVGDGSTYRWWLKQFDLLGYDHKVLYLNSMFFGTPQSRDRLYIAFWDKKIPAPNLDHCPHAWCSHCQAVVEARWTWKTGVPPTGSVRYGRQYNYRCPSCRTEVVPPVTPSLAALDLTDLGTRIGDRDKPLADTTMARAARCKERFADFPAVLMPVKALRGSERHPWQPMATQTSRQETGLLHTGAVIAAQRHNGDGKHITEPMDTVTATPERAVLSTGAIMQMANAFEHPGSTCRTRDLTEPLWAQLATNTTGLFTPGLALAVDSFQGAPRGGNEALPTQGGSETLAIVSAGVVPYRRNTIPTSRAEAMPTITAEQIPGLVTAAGRVQCNGSLEEAKYRSYPLDRPLSTVVGSAVTQGVLFSGWQEPQGKALGPDLQPVLDPYGVRVGGEFAEFSAAEWREALADLALDDCFFRMLGSHEIGRGCGFDVPFGDHPGTFVVWGSSRAQTDGFGNAVSPAVGEWIGSRLHAALHGGHEAPTGIGLAIRPEPSVAWAEALTITKASDNRQPTLPEMGSTQVRARSMRNPSP